MSDSELLCSQLGHEQHSVCKRSVAARPMHGPGRAHWQRCYNSPVSHLPSCCTPHVTPVSQDHWFARLTSVPKTCTTHRLIRLSPDGMHHQHAEGSVYEKVVINLFNFFRRYISSPFSNCYSYSPHLVITSYFSPLPPHLISMAQILMLML